MIGWLQSIDLSLFRFINLSLGNSVFDRIMPFVSDSPLLTSLFFFAFLALIWKGGARGRICAMMLVLTVFLGNALVCDSIKNALARVRPFDGVPGAILRVGRGGSFSMPSSHAANWLSLTVVLAIYYRRTIWFMLPFSLLVCLSRIYNGVHYPSDVIAGGLLGAGYAVAVIWLCDALWQFAGPRWFPSWKEQLPSLIQPVVYPSRTEGNRFHDAQWLRLGYLLAGILLIVRLGYLASGKIELSEDEAYQWLWSKHPALSYYSKPPLIAMAQYAGTHLWGDNEFGVRFFSPVITAIMSILVLRFMAREAAGRTAFFLLLALNACPLLALGSIVMTVDPWSVLFWMAALLSGWRACSPTGSTRDWCWTGLWMGLGFLSKYTNLLQFVCWAVFVLLWPPARVHFRRAGPWLALLIILVSSLPVVIWNSQHHWITVAHVASDGKLGESSDRNFVMEFILVEAGVLNPVLFVGALWAAIGIWSRQRREPLRLYLFSMGAPVFLMFFILSFHARVLANWIAPSVVPLFCLMAIYWGARWRNCAAIARPVFAAGLVGGLAAVVIAHDTQLLNKLFHRHLPPRVDVMHRVRGWKETARIVDEARTHLTIHGIPPFVICDHYGLTSELSFYSPEARERSIKDPVVFYRATANPDNQFYFWPNYLGRVGQNALFVREADTPRLRPGWFGRWWNRNDDIYLADTPAVHPLPVELIREFAAVKDLGIRDIRVNGDIIRRVELFDCQNLR